MALVHRVVAGLARSEIAGVNPHTLAIALVRAEREQIDFTALAERQIAAILLERSGYPITVEEFTLFLSHPNPIVPATLVPEELTDEHATYYVRWVAAFLDDPDANTSRNARALLRWLVANRRTAIAADRASLANLRRLADDPAPHGKASAFIVYALGACGSVEEDYERVTRHAELVIEHDREHLDLVADGLYYLYPPALISALQFFLERTEPGTRGKQFSTGMVLLAKVADIEDRAFWRTYYGDMVAIVDRLSDAGLRNQAVQRVLDRLEKHLALSTLDEEL